MEEPRKRKKKKISNLREMLSAVGDLSIFQEVENGFPMLLVDSDTSIAICGISGKFLFVLNTYSDVDGVTQIRKI